MSDLNEQVPFVPDIPDPTLVADAEQRCPCVLLLDTSSSMRGAPIRELNEGLVTFKDELMADGLARKRVEIAVVTFGPVKIEREFQTADVFQVPTLEANGDTPMGAAIETAITLVRDRKEQYKQHGVSYYRPWIFLITDGAPTDNWRNAAQLVRTGEESKSFKFFSVGVKGYDKEILAQISVSEPVRLLDETRFRDLFRWLSGSLKTASQAVPGEPVALENPTGPQGWGIVD